MGILRKLIQNIPGGRALAETVSYRRRSRKLRKIGDPEARFTHIFDANKWKDDESRSGAGSSLAATAEIRAALPAVLAELEVSTLLDAPCGDYNWFQLVDTNASLTYIGGDIVKPLIESNAARFGDENRSFVHLDITADPLPSADLWVCRDCLIHLSYDDILRTLENFRNAAIDYWLVTTHRGVERNIDIPTGHCRMINLERAPFGFPPPRRYVEENDDQGTGKCLGLWRREQLSDLHP